MQASKKFHRQQAANNIHRLTVFLKECFDHFFGYFIYLFYLYIYPSDSQESDEGAITYGKQLPRPASEMPNIVVHLKFFIEI